MAQSAEGVHRQRGFCTNVLAQIANRGGVSDLNAPGPVPSEPFDQH
jgi:hypothetical protein